MTRLRVSASSYRELAATVRRMYDAGFSTASIGERLNISQQAARDLLRESYRESDEDICYGPRRSSDRRDP